MYIILGKSTSKTGVVYDFFKPSLRNTSSSSTTVTASINPSTTSHTNKTEQSTSNNSTNPLASDKKPDEHLKGEEYIFLILRLPSAAVFALEQQQLGWRKFPFFGEQIQLANDCGVKE